MSSISAGSGRRVGVFVRNYSEFSESDGDHRQLITIVPSASTDRLAARRENKNTGQGDFRAG